MSSAPIPTYEQMMALFLENREQLKETDRILKDAIRKSEEDQRAWNKRFAEFGDRLGELIETMVERGVVRLFQELGYSFSRCSRNTKFRDETLGVHGEIDLFLEDGDDALLIEVKTKLSIDDVKDHIERVGKFRSYADARNDKR